MIYLSNLIFYENISLLVLFLSRMYLTIIVTQLKMQSNYYDQFVQKSRSAQSVFLPLFDVLFHSV